MRGLLVRALVLTMALTWLAAGSSAETRRVPPTLPTQFSADVAVVSHLTDPRQSYPPSARHMRIQYDFAQRVAKAEMLRGYEANKTYVRRYDTKREYMVKHGQYKKCERAYLGILAALDLVGCMGSVPSYA